MVSIFMALFSASDAIAHHKKSEEGCTDTVVNVAGLFQPERKPPLAEAKSCHSADPFCACSRKQGVCPISGAF